MTDVVDELCESHQIKGQCALHRLLWEHHDNDRREHRTELCEKIIHLTNTITSMVPKWVFVLITTASFSFSLLLFGWIANNVNKSNDDLKNEITHVASLVQRVNVRITETVNDRVKTDLEQTAKLESIDGKLGTVSWRLKELEDTHKMPNKFMPDSKR